MVVDVLVGWVDSCWDVGSSLSWVCAFETCPSVCVMFCIV